MPYSKHPIAFDHVIDIDYTNDPHADSTRRNVSKRLNKASNGIKNLFTKYARLMVVRVDLWYQHPNVYIPRHDAMQDFDLLWDQIDQHPLLHDYVGWVWKMEYGQDRGTHYHLVLIYNGAKHQRDEYFGLEVKRLWESAVATNAFHINQAGYSQASRIGSGFVCNLQKATYSYPCLGVIHRDDAVARQGLMDMITYLAKADGLIGNISARGERNFGTMYKM